jgi:two-component system LytT family response regulator
VFLDVQMPGRDGFGVIEAVPETQLPVVVFVTAFDEHALRAFEVHAFDYLLKPFDAARFNKTVERVRAQLAKSKNGSHDSRLQSLLEELRSKPAASTRFAVRTPGRVFFVKQEEIDWIEAADNYVCLHVGADTHLLRETMNSIEQRLDASKFARIHRSTIVNLDRIKELRPWFHGEYVVILRQGTELTLSRSYRDKVLGALNAQ